MYRPVNRSQNKIIQMFPILDTIFFTNFQVDHTIIIYLVNPDGEFVDYFGQTKTAQDIFNCLQISVEKYKAMKSKWF